MEHVAPSAPGRPRRRVSLAIELAALAAALAVALAFRLYRLGEFPPGFHFDEAIDLKIAFDVLRGARPLYVSEGWGREALYYYLAAPMLQLVPYNPLALRAASVLCGLGLLVAAYGLARRWRGPLAAWLTTAWLGVAMWPVWAARYGVRNITLGLMIGLAVWAFWWAFDERRQGGGARATDRFLIAGLLLGLTAYTYQAARFMPLLFLLFLLYLALFHRRPPWTDGRGWLVWGATAALVALPLALILSRATFDELGERAFSIEPLTELLAGNPRPILSNVVATAGAFTARGDPLKSYNLPDRPLFVPRWTGLFFYAGLALALWRWRQPRYAFVLLWLAVALLPTIVTVSAPNFGRMVAAQFPVFFLAALAATEGIGWAAGRARWAGGVAALLVAVALGWTVAATYRDFFHVWPEQYADQTHTFNREIAAVADYLEHGPDGRPVVISSRDIEDEDPYVVAVSLDRVVERRWVDTSQALALPAGVAEARLIVTANRWIDPLLIDRGAPVAAGSHERFTVYELRDGPWLAAGAPALALPPEAGNAPAPPYPIPFCECAPGATPTPAVLLAGVTAGPGRPGQELTLLTSWETVAETRFVSLAMFVHLLDGSGAIVAQDDGLGYPPHTWQRGDRFVQLARLPLPADLPPGDYILQFGLYDRGSGARWPALDAAGQPVGDRLLLPVTVERGDG